MIIVNIDGHLEEFIREAATKANISAEELAVNLLEVVISSVSDNKKPSKKKSDA